MKLWHPCCSHRQLGAQDSCGLLQLWVTRDHTLCAGLASPLQTSPGVGLGLLEAFCCSAFSHTASLSAAHAWGLPKSCLHALASSQLTIDSVIEPKGRSCSHSLRNFRRSRVNFLQEAKKWTSNKKHHFPALVLTFSIHRSPDAPMYQALGGTKGDWGIRGDQYIVSFLRIWSVMGKTDIQGKQRNGKHHSRGL